MCSVSWILVSLIALWALSSLGPEIQISTLNLSITAGFVAGAIVGLLYVGAAITFGRAEWLEACVGLGLLLAPALFGLGALIFVDLQQRASLSQLVLGILGALPFLALITIMAGRTYPRWGSWLSTAREQLRRPSPMPLRERRERRVQAASIATALALAALLAGSADAQVVSARHQPSLVLASGDATSGTLPADKLQRYLDLEAEEGKWLAENARYQSLLGSDEIRRLDRVRYELQYFRTHPLEMEAYASRHQRVRGMMRDVARHMAQDYLEQQLEIEDIEVRWKNKMKSMLRRDEAPAQSYTRDRTADERGAGDRHFSISPQARISDDPSLGVKMRLKGGEGFLSRFSVRFDQWLSSDRQRVRFHYYQGGSFDGALELSAGDEEDARGERVGIWMRARF